MSHVRSIRFASDKLLPLTLLRYALGMSACVIGANGYCAGPLPQGGKFIAGAGTMQPMGNTLEVRQSSPRAVIDWRSFSIGDGNRVDIQNGAGATLGRVSGAQRSVIDGRLDATGSFYLINPQGVLIGRSGVVDTGGASSRRRSTSTAMRSWRAAR